MKPLALALVVFAAFLLGCSNSSKVVSPVHSSRASTVSSQKLTDCEKTQELYQHRLSVLQEALAQVQAIENKTDQDIAAVQALEELILNVQAERDQALCEACPGSC